MRSGSALLLLFLLLVAGGFLLWLSFAEAGQSPELGPGEGEGVRLDGGVPGPVESDPARSSEAGEAQRHCRDGDASRVETAGDLTVRVLDGAGQLLGGAGLVARYVLPNGELQSDFVLELGCTAEGSGEAQIPLRRLVEFAHERKVEPGRLRIGLSGPGLHDVHVRPELVDGTLVELTMPACGSILLKGLHALPKSDEIFVLVRERAERTSQPWPESGELLFPYVALNAWGSRLWSTSRRGLRA